MFAKLISFVKRFLGSSRELRMEFWWTVVWYTFFVGVTLYYLRILAGRHQQEVVALNSESCEWITVFIQCTCIFGVIRILFDPAAVFIDISAKMVAEEEEREGSGSGPRESREVFNPAVSLGCWANLFVVYLYVVRWLTLAWIMSGIWILVYYSLMNCQEGVLLLEFTSIMLVCMSVLGFFLATLCDFFSWLTGNHDPTELTHIRVDGNTNYNSTQNSRATGNATQERSVLDLDQLKENSWCFVVAPAHLSRNFSYEDFTAIEKEKEKEKEKPSAEELIKDCTICQEPIVVGNLACRLRCGHYYHQNCISCWAAIKPTCPNCCRPVLEPK